MTLGRVTLCPCRSRLLPPAQLTARGKTFCDFLLNITFKGAACCHLQGAGAHQDGSGTLEMPEQPRTGLGWVLGGSAPPHRGEEGGDPRCCPPAPQSRPLPPHPPTSPGRAFRDPPDPRTDRDGTAPTRPLSGSRGPSRSVCATAGPRPGLQRPEHPPPHAPRDSVQGIWILLICCLCIKTRSIGAAAGAPPA